MWHNDKDNFSGTHTHVLLYYDFIQRVAWNSIRKSSDIVLFKATGLHLDRALVEWLNMIHVCHSYLWLFATPDLWPNQSRAVNNCNYQCWMVKVKVTCSVVANVSGSVMSLNLSVLAIQDSVPCLTPKKNGNWYLKTFFDNLLHDHSSVKWWGGGKQILNKIYFDGQLYFFLIC